MYALLLAVIGCTVLILSTVPWKYQWRAVDWKRLLYVYGLVSVPFVLIDSISHARGWWAYNPDHVGSATLLGLPIEECLFFFVIPFACLYLYGAMARLAVLNKVVTRRWLYGILCLSVVFAVVMSFIQPLERTIVDAALLALVVGIFIVSRPRITRAFIVWIGAVLILFFVTNSILTGVPIVTYDHAFGSAMRIGSVPIEDFWYNFSLLLSAWLVWSRRGRHPVLN